MVDTPLHSQQEGGDKGAHGSERERGRARRVEFFPPFLEYKESRRLTVAGKSGWGGKEEDYFKNLIKAYRSSSRRRRGWGGDMKESHQVK